MADVSSWLPLVGPFTVEDDGTALPRRGTLNIVGAAITDDASNEKTTIDLSALGGGAGTPGGADTQVQINDGGAFGGDAGLTYNKTTDVLTVTGGVIVGNGGYVSIGSSAVATTGQLRLRNDTSGAVFARNGADSADLRVMMLDSANRVFLGQSTGVSGVILEGATGHVFNIAGSTIVTVLATGIAVLGSVAGGTSPAGIGVFRAPYFAASTAVLGGKASAGTDDAIIKTGGFGLTLGDSTAWSTQIEGNPLGLWGRTGVTLYAGAAQQAGIILPSAATSVTFALPRHGSSTPYASEGYVEVAGADAGVTLTAAQYSRRFVTFTTGTVTVPWTATLPNPANDDGAYEQAFENLSGQTVTLSVGAGTTANLASGSWARFRVRNNAVVQF